MTRRSGGAGLFNLPASTAYDTLDEGQKQLLSGQMSRTMGVKLVIKAGAKAIIKIQSQVSYFMWCIILSS